MEERATQLHKRYTWFIRGRSAASSEQEAEFIARYGSHANIIPPVVLGHLISAPWWGLLAVSPLCPGSGFYLLQTIHAESILCGGVRQHHVGVVQHVQAV